MLVLTFMWGLALLATLGGAGGGLYLLVLVLNVLVLVLTLRLWRSPLIQFLVLSC